MTGFFKYKLPTKNAVILCIQLFLKNIDIPLQKF